MRRNCFNHCCVPSIYTRAWDMVVLRQHLSSKDIPGSLAELVLKGPKAQGGVRYVRAEKSPAWWGR